MVISLVLLGGVALGATAKTVYDNHFAEAIEQWDAVRGESGDSESLIVQIGETEDLLGEEALSSGHDRQDGSDFAVVMTLFRAARDQEPDGYTLHVLYYNAPKQSWYAEYRPIQ